MRGWRGRSSFPLVAGGDILPRIAPSFCARCGVSPPYVSPPHTHSNTKEKEKRSRSQLPSPFPLPQHTHTSQVQSNALAALEALDPTVADAIMGEGVMTGDRVNGLVDGASGDWYVKFDMFHLAVDQGLPVTRVISRFTLQRLLAEACERIGGPDVLVNEANVVSFTDAPVGAGPGATVWAATGDGRRFEGDLLIGADGIWSKVRTTLFGPAPATYSDYTCYTGIADFTPPDIDLVGYRVFLGHGKYFVSSDVGDGKMQWYGFHKEAAGGEDADGSRKARLLDIFGDWTDQVTDLVRATPEADVLRRDIFDRPPIMSWASGRVALLGDSAHAMQPNLGQGGCMAIEDGYQLANDLTDAVAAARAGSGKARKGGLAGLGATLAGLFGGAGVDVPEGGGEGAAPTTFAFDAEAVLKRYQASRIPRAAAIHGLARMAAVMASTYKAYLGEGLGPLEAPLARLRIPHPGRVGGYVAINAAMPSMLAWVLGGNKGALRAEDRPLACRAFDKPAGFDEADFPALLADDAALLHRARATWFLAPVDVAGANASSDALDAAASGSAAQAGAAAAIALPDGSVEVGPAAGGRAARESGCGADIVLGSAGDVRIAGPAVAPAHLAIRPAPGSEAGGWVAADLGSGLPSWVDGRRVPAGGSLPLRPGDRIELGAQAIDAREGEPAPAPAWCVKAVHGSVVAARAASGGWAAPTRVQREAAAKGKGASPAPSSQEPVAV